MPKYRYTGTEPARYGSGLIMPGSISELSFAPDKHFELVRDITSRAIPKPIRHIPEKVKENTNG